MATACDQRYHPFHILSKEQIRLMGANAMGGNITAAVDEFAIVGVDMASGPDTQAWAELAPVRGKCEKLERITHTLADQLPWSSHLSPNHCPWLKPLHL